MSAKAACHLCGMPNAREVTFQDGHEGELCTECAVMNDLDIECATCGNQLAGGDNYNLASKRREWPDDCDDCNAKEHARIARAHPYD